MDRGAIISNIKQTFCSGSVQTGTNFALVYKKDIGNTIQNVVSLFAFL